MKKRGIIARLFISVIIIIFIVCTKRVDSTPYFESAYFKKSCLRADSLDKITFPVNNSLYAGFAKVSITHVINNNEENITEGKFKQIPLAGYGDRKGRPSTGIHDSIFAKAPGFTKKLT